MGLRRRAGGVAVATSLLLMAPGTPAPAAEPPAERRETIASEITELEESLDDVAAEEQALHVDLERTQRLKADLDAEVAVLDARVAAARSELRGASRALDAAMAEHLHTTERLDRTKRELARSRRLIRDQAITAYIHLGAPSAELDGAVRFVDPTDAGRARVLADVVTETQSDVVDQHQVLRERAGELEAFAVSARRTADEQETEVAERTEAVERLHADMERARQEVAVEAERETVLLAETQNRKAAYEQQILALRQESDSLSSMLRERQSAQVVLTSGAGALGLPLMEPRITSKFGYRVHPIYKTRRLHAGTDFGASSGTPILAAADGVVASAGVRGGYGNAVVIDHGGALATLYAHQSRMAVTSGQKVVRGQVIGYVGSTGASTGPHLHFEVRVNGTPVDPMRYL